MAASFLLAGCAVGDKDAVTIGLTYVPNVQFAPVYMADAEGFFSEDGLGVKVRHHGSDEGLFTALVAGEENVTIASGDEVLQARASGMDVVSIGAFYNRYPVAIISLKESPVKTLSDLRGKSIGLPGEFGSDWFGLLAALKDAGLTVSDVDVQSIGYTQAASLAAGRVDAVVGFMNSDAVQLRAMGLEIEVLELANFDVPLVGASIVTTSDWLEENPDRARAVLAGITRGMDAVIADPDAALEASKHWDKSLTDPKALETASALLSATLPLWQRDGGASTVQDLQTWQRMGPFLAEVLDVPLAQMRPDGAVTNDYAS